MRARAVGYVLIGVAALFAARAVVFVPEASACLPGFKPKPGVTNPTDNARDCEPEGGSAPPPPSPQGGTSAPPGPERTKKDPPIVSPSEQRKKVEDRLRKRSKGEDGEQATDASGPKAPPGGKADGTDEAIKRLGKKLGQDGERAEEPKVSAYPLSRAEIDQLIRGLMGAEWVVDKIDKGQLPPPTKDASIELDPLDETMGAYLDETTDVYVTGDTYGYGMSVTVMEEMADGIDESQLPPPTSGGQGTKRERN